MPIWNSERHWRIVQRIVQKKWMFHLCLQLSALGLGFPFRGLFQIECPEKDLHCSATRVCSRSKESGLSGLWDLPATHQTEMILEMFCNMLAHICWPYRPPTLEEIWKQGNNFYKLNPSVVTSLTLLINKWRKNRQLLPDLGIATLYDKNDCSNLQMRWIAMRKTFYTPRLKK